MAGFDPAAPGLRRAGRFAVRAGLWGLGIAVGTAAVVWRGNPGLSVLGFFALAFVCWDGAFLLWRAWRGLHGTQPPIPEATGVDFGEVEVVEVPLVPAGPVWAACEGRPVEVRLEEVDAVPAREVVDVVVERLDGRLVLCPAGERPPVPLELVAMQAVVCRLESGAVVAVVPDAEIRRRPAIGSE